MGTLGQTPGFFVARVRYIATQVSALRDVSRRRVKNHATGLARASAAPILGGVRHCHVFGTDDASLPGMALLLPDDEIRALWEELIDAGLAERRGMLIAGIDSHVIGSIVDNQVPNDRIGRDLRKLNDDGYGEPGKHPLILYLLNAQVCVRPKRLVVLTEALRKLRNEVTTGPAHWVLLTSSKSTDACASARVLADRLGYSWNQAEELLDKPCSLARAPDRDVAEYVTETLRRLAVDARAIRCPTTIRAPRVRALPMGHVMFEIPDPCSPPAVLGAQPATLWCGVKLVSPPFYRSVVVSKGEQLTTRAAVCANVPFVDALAFCRTLSQLEAIKQHAYRLPTDLEYQWIFEHTLGLVDPSSTEWLSSRSRIGPDHANSARIAGFRLVQLCPPDETLR